MTATFTWRADGKLTGTTDLRTLTAQFGDGYKQEAADGINSASQSWPLTFTRLSAEIKDIRDFLNAQGGYKSFYWTPPLGTQGYYRCKSHSEQHLGGDTWLLSCTFEQSFQP